MHLILRLPDGPVEGHDYHDSKGESVASPSARNRSESMIQRAFNPPQIWYPSGNLRFTGFVSRSLKLAFESGVGMDRQAPATLTVDVTRVWLAHPCVTRSNQPRNHRYGIPSRFPLALTTRASNLGQKTPLQCTHVFLKFRPLREAAPKSGGPVRGDGGRHIHQALSPPEVSSKRNFIL